MNRLPDQRTYRLFTLALVKSAAAATAVVGILLFGQTPGLGEQADTAATHRAQAATAPVILTEVLFSPAPGDSPFVELLNVGKTPVNLSRMALRAADTGVLLARVTTPLDPGGRLVIRFDGESRVDGLVFHAPKVTALRAEGGSLELRDERGRRMDVVAWGDAPGSFNRYQGGLFGDAGPPASALARAPGANRPSHPDDWSAYAASRATPGFENPMPAVDMLIPFAGEAISGPLRLFWYPVTGATSYRVQLASNERFGGPLLIDRVVKNTRIDVGTLPPGPYFWRVQAIGATNVVASYSEPHSLEVLAETETDDAALAEGPGDQQTVLPPALPVPMIEQHKDTQMLSLEVNQRKGTHAWDSPHGGYDANDPADATNCVAASIAMINRFLGGDLSQDRIGYEPLGKNGPRYAAAIERARLRPAGVAARELEEKQTGPEWDLIYRDGLNGAQVLAAAAFAFSANGSPPGSVVPSVGRYSTVTGIFDALTAQIAGNRPVLGVRANSTGSGQGPRNHAFVVRGVGRDANGRRFLLTNDPIGGPRQPYIDGMQNTTPQDFVWIFLPSNAAARTQEFGVSFDSDGDGIVDFDETERFHTDPKNGDTDKDGVLDGNDVASSIFDPQYGYAKNPVANSQGRDFDRDGVPTEHDPDSDAGGCLDGVEDEDGDGETDPLENWNFFNQDDACRSINGHVTLAIEAEKTGDIALYLNEEFSVSVALKPETPGQMGTLLDNGSRFTMHRTGQMEISIDQDCRIITRSEANGSGDFRDTSFGGSVHGTELVMDGQGDVPADTTVDMCVWSNTGTETTSGSLASCTANRVSKTSLTYAFDCRTPPPGPPPFPGFRWLRWSMTGRVMLQLNPESLLELITPPRSRTPDRLHVVAARGGARFEFR